MDRPLAGTAPGIAVVPGTTPVHGARPPREFFARDPLEVAPELLGGFLVRSDAEGTVAVRLTEVEAYAGGRDPGSHTYRGRTPRNASMFGPGGHLYCYLSYGIHFALNIVCGEDGEGYGCLLRSGEVVAGADLARRRRELKPRKSALPDHQLARGPGCLATCFGATVSQDGDDLLGTEWQFILPGGRERLPHLTGPRVGLSLPGGDGDVFPWRFWLPNDPTVSAYKPAARRRSSEPGSA
jgi:DNA-3-methyladenine glycosylase